MRSRITIALGAALLVGGWGTIQYAREQQQAVSVDHMTRVDFWIGYEMPEPGILPGRWVFAAGVLAMAMGAGLLGFALVPRCERTP